MGTEKCVFVCPKTGTLLLLYVDDILIVSQPKDSENTVALLKTLFTCDKVDTITKDDGEKHLSFLGIDI